MLFEKKNKTFFFYAFRDDKIGWKKTKKNGISISNGVMFGIWELLENIMNDFF